MISSLMIIIYLKLEMSCGVFLRFILRFSGREELLGGYFWYVRSLRGWKKKNRGWVVGVET